MFHKLSLTVASIVGLGMAGAAQGAFVLVEDFDGLSPGAINGQNGWTADDASVDVVAGGFSGQGLQNGANSTEAYKAIPVISDGSTGTVFFQINFASLIPGQSFGVADADVSPNIGGSYFDNYRAQLALTAAGDFTARNVSTAKIDNVSIAVDTWYDIWMVIDNDAHTWEAYIRGGDILAQTKLSASGVSVFGYRGVEPDNADIASFLFARGTGDANSVTIDNLWVDTAGQNLSNPIPEPAALALMGLGSLVALSRRRT